MTGGNDDDNDETEDSSNSVRVNSVGFNCVGVNGVGVHSVESPQGFRHSTAASSISDRLLSDRYGGPASNTSKILSPRSVGGGISAHGTVGIGLGGGGGGDVGGGITLTRGGVGLSAGSSAGSSNGSSSASARHGVRAGVNSDTVTLGSSRGVTTVEEDEEELRAAQAVTPAEVTKTSDVFRRLTNNATQLDNSYQTLRQARLLIDSYDTLFLLVCRGHSLQTVVWKTNHIFSSEFELLTYTTPKIRTRFEMAGDCRLLTDCAHNLGTIAKILLSTSS